MRIGEVAKHLDISASAIRYYEKKGLIKPPERVFGKRKFSNSALVTLKFIQLCQAAGFTISEMQKILEQHIEDSSQTGLWQPAVENKQKEIKKQIDKLKVIDALCWKS